MQYLFRFALNPEKGKDDPHIGSEADGRPPFIIRHNLRSRTSIMGLAAEFSANESYRIRKRKDSVRIFHTIISFSNQDREYVTDEVLRGTAKQFIKLRAQNCLVLGTCHRNTESIHLHLLVSGTYLSGRSARLSKEKFHSLKIKLNKYQRQAFPELSHSLPEHGKGRRLAKEALMGSLKQEQWKNVDTARLAGFGLGKPSPEKALLELQELRKGRRRELQKEERPIKKKEVAKDLMEPETKAELEALAEIRGRHREEQERTFEPALEGSSDSPDLSIGLEESEACESESASLDSPISKLPKQLGLKK